jgi:HSP20 family protein
MKRDMEKQVLTEFRRMRDEIDRLFEGLVPGGALPARRQFMCSPPTDVYETVDMVIVRMEIGGMEDQDFQIAYAGGVLTIAGVRRDPEREPRAYQQMEIWSGPFRTQVKIPWHVDADRIEAHYHDGFLRVRMPKLTRTTEIPVRSPEERRRS